MYKATPNYEVTFLVIPMRGPLQTIQTVEVKTAQINSVTIEEITVCKIASDGTKCSSTLDGSAVQTYRSSDKQLLTHDILFIIDLRLLTHGPRNGHTLYPRRESLFEFEQLEVVILSPPGLIFLKSRSLSPSFS